MRRASMVLPLPGGPKRSRLWPPAAATSSARLATSCPATSQRSSGGGKGGAGGASCRGGRGASPRAQATICATCLTAWTVSPSTTAASWPLASGTTRALAPARRAAMATGRTPRTGFTSPESDSSPRKWMPWSAAGGSSWLAASRATAMGTSSPAPSLRRSAGARFTTTRFEGSLTPQLRTAASTRTWASETALPASPTRWKRGIPFEVSTSTSTGRASTPRTTAERTHAIMADRRAAGVPAESGLNGGERGGGGAGRRPVRPRRGRSAPARRDSRTSTPARRRCRPAPA